MIDENRTLELFGYTSDSLSHASHKKVVAVCDECGEVRFIDYRQYRDRCRGCATQTDETRAKMSESKKGERNPNYGKKLSGEQKKKLYDANKGKHQSDATKKKISIAKKGKCGGENHPFYGKHQSDDTKKKISIAKKGKKLSDETRQRMSESAKNPSDETRQARSDRQKGQTHSDETKKKMSASASASWVESRRKDVCGVNNPNWQGGKSFEPYCHKFNEAFKEYIREKFGRICFLCPKTEAETGRKLSVHHVNYDKNCLCDDVKCEFVPLCMSCHAKTNFNQEYWENLIMERLKANSRLLNHSSTTH